jgi:geranylgeranyl transferase type-2 subunit beta
VAQIEVSLPWAWSCCRHQHRVRKRQPDGGFAGREGPSDLYYTGFALRGLAVLGQLYGPVADQAARFLQSRMAGQAAIVDALSLIYGAALLESASGKEVFASVASGWQDALSDWLETLRRDDGGYAKAPEGRASSTYHTFLVLLCRQLIERPVPEPHRIVEFLRQQEVEDGGFLEIRAGKRAGTNPTAAAIGALRILSALDEPTRELTADFLQDMQTDEGGLRANTRIPFADLLSTFTGCLTLQDLDALDRIDVAAARRYCESMEVAGGGFHGFALDEQRDVEYTFYGIGGLALLTRP